MPAGEAQTAAAPQVRKIHVATSLGLQWAWASDKYMPGLALGLRGQSLGLILESGLVGLLQPAPGTAQTFLGNSFGAALTYAALRTSHLELSLGLGCDVYYLWNLHPDKYEIALAARAEAHYWFAGGPGVYLGARAYPVASRGLELGTTRAGGGSLPVLFTTGIEWRTR